VPKAQRPKTIEFGFGGFGEYKMAIRPTAWTMTMIYSGKAGLHFDAIHTPQQESHSYGQKNNSHRSALQNMAAKGSSY